MQYLSGGHHGNQNSPSYHFSSRESSDDSGLMLHVGTCKSPVLPQHLLTKFIFQSIPQFFVAANGSEVTQISSFSAVGNSVKVLRVSQVQSCLTGKLCHCLMTSKVRILHQIRCGLKSFKKATILIAVGKGVQQCSCCKACQTNLIVQDFFFFF